LDAVTDERLHLVQLLVASDELDKSARAVAAEIAVNAPLAVQGVKHDIDAYADAGLAAALDRTAMSAALTLTSDDSREGYGAKGARRVPRFQGK
jgi:enoyl-CoA hydratase/carnithine racemase